MTGACGAIGNLAAKHFPPAQSAKSRSPEMPVSSM
jgi:hypothetical protein